jgi:hypothetical protein
MTDKETLKLALDLVIMHHTDDGYSELRQKVRHAIKQALAAPVQEPVATVQCINGITIGYLDVMQPVGTKLYITPPQNHV